MGSPYALLGTASGFGEGIKELLARRMLERQQNEVEQARVAQNAFQQQQLQEQTGLRKATLANTASNEEANRLQQVSLKNMTEVGANTRNQNTITGANERTAKMIAAQNVPVPVESVNPRTLERLSMGTAAKGTHFVPMPPPETGQSNTRSDRSYQFAEGQLGKLRQPLADQAERIARLTVSLDQNSPAADPLVAPELLTAMAGGPGSGLRMNEAEIARIVGGRNAWENLKSQVLRWQADKSKPFQLLPEQRGQIRALVGAVAQRNAERQQLLDEGSQALIDAPDVTTHRHIVADTRKKLRDSENAVSAGPQANTITKPTADELIKKYGG